MLPVNDVEWEVSE